MLHQSFSVWNRRRILKVLGAAALLPSTTVDAATSCANTTPTVTEGPYWVEEHLFRSDVRTDPGTGVARQGVPLTLTINVVNANTSCAALEGAYVDIWHCDAIGIYSDEATYNPGGGTGNVTTTGQKFLRGYQLTDSNGQVVFTTIYPGWYSGRTIHIHVRIRTYNGITALTNYTTQIFFDDTINNKVMAVAPYNTRTSARDTTNSTDSVYTTAGSNASSMLVTPVAGGSGYTAAITIDLAATTSTSATPVIAPNAIVNAASGAPGASPGSWISIFGTSLAAETYALESEDVVNSQFPTILQNVRVSIDGNPAFMDFISAEQLNVLVPADATTGSVLVSVTNAGGASASIATTLQPILPGLFTLSNYVRAVRVSDGAILSATTAASAGDVIELYGTGFGPTTTSVAAGLVFTGAYPTSNAVTVTIGGVAAPVSFAGLVGPGLYQINLTVPSGLSSGDNAVVATVGGFNTQSNALLRIV